jgi:hypothetical protein
MEPRDGQPQSGGTSRFNQSVAGGLVLIALAAFCIYATRALDQGTLSSMGPGVLPRWLAVMVGACGILLLIAGLAAGDEPIVGFSARAAILVPLSIIAFALTVRPVDIGGFQTPGLGLVVAGPLAVLIGGYASPEARLKELLPLALILTGFCIALFGDLLNLTIPIYPPALQSYVPPGWSHHAVLRQVAGATAGVGLMLLALVLLASRIGGRRG